MSELISRALRITGDDPAIAIRLRVNPLLDHIEVGGQDVLVAVYEPPKDAKTAGGIIMPDGSRNEYRWQGVTGLVMKVGPFAYNTEKTTGWFADKDGNPAPPKAGDWVMFDVKTSHPFFLDTQPCRFVGCQYILAKISRPDLVA